MTTILTQQDGWKLGDTVDPGKYGLDTANYKTWLSADDLNALTNGGTLKRTIVTNLCRALYINQPLADKFAANLGNNGIIILLINAPYLKSSQECALMAQQEALRLGKPQITVNFPLFVRSDQPQWEINQSLQLIDPLLDINIFTIVKTITEELYDSDNATYDEYKLNVSASVDLSLTGLQKLARIMQISYNQMRIPGAIALQ